MPTLDPAVLAAFVACGLLAFGCAAPETARRAPAEHRPSFDATRHRAPSEIAAEDLALEVEDREVVRGARGQNLLRVRFSFISVRGYPHFDDVHRSSGVVFFPVDAQGRADPANKSEVLVTEYPPGSSAGGFPLYEEYGERPAVELGIPAAIVDLRGPIVSSLKLVRNPADPAGGVFTSEEQFALEKLHDFARDGDYDELYEMRVGQAWLRALKAMNRVLAAEMPGASHRTLLVGEGYGAIAALQAAGVYDSVQGVVLCGWPMDWFDYHFVRWRRWEREARYFPLESVQPLTYSDSRALLSFLSSSYANPDPGCPTCEAGGDEWLAQLDAQELRYSGALDGVETYFLFGDSDPRLPVDLELRSCVSPEALRSFPRPPAPGDDDRGPFSRRTRFPYTDLAYLEGAASTLAQPGASAAVLAWMQHLAGHRDIPQISVEESEVDGDVVLDVSVREGNAAVGGIEVRLVDIPDGDDSDFRAPLHRADPEPMGWRRIDATYAGHGDGFRQKWRAVFPLTRSANRAYQVVVKDRVGDLEAAHALPTRTLWYLGDPAVGPARF